jgi:hypothetical protein
MKIMRLLRGVHNGHAISLHVSYLAYDMFSSGWKNKTIELINQLDCFWRVLLTVKH